MEFVALMERRLVSSAHPSLDDTSGPFSSSFKYPQPTSEAIHPLCVFFNWQSVPNGYAQLEIVSPFQHLNVTQLSFNIFRGKTFPAQHLEHSDLHKVFPKAKFNARCAYVLFLQLSEVNLPLCYVNALGVDNLPAGVGVIGAVPEVFYNDRGGKLGLRKLHIAICYWLNQVNYSSSISQVRNP